MSSTFYWSFRNFHIQFLHENTDLDKLKIWSFLILKKYFRYCHWCTTIWINSRLSHVWLFSYCLFPIAYQPDVYFVCSWLEWYRLASIECFITKYTVLYIEIVSVFLTWPKIEIIFEIQHGRQKSKMAANIVKRVMNTM